MNQGCCAIFVAHATHNFSWYLLLSWLPKMLADEGASICVAGLLSVLPFLAAFLISNIGACVADRCLLRRCGLTRTRKLMQVTSQLGKCLTFCVFAVFPQPGAAATSALSTLAVGFGALSHSGFWANIIDVAPDHSGILLGISNTLGTIPGVLCNIVAGQILQAGLGWRPIFILSAMLDFIGAVTFGMFARAEVQVR